MKWIYRYNRGDGQEIEVGIFETEREAWDDRLDVICVIDSGMCSYPFEVFDNYVLKRGEG
jgi:hypothetical protein